ncbi:MAG: WD40/YVTN/BNR-like repeat-containing protein [Planctomycetota bacterium]|jgi:photosystem II stability/assembly factor-like uncharacterized protein
MSDRILLGTRKGVFDVRHGGDGWQIGEPRLLGQPVPYAVRDARDGRIWASLDHGHWGSKMARSADDGASYEEIDPPKYPEPTGKSVRYYWVLQPGHPDTPEVFWVGTEPGGLFRTADGGTTWTLVESLWEMCVRDGWTGGGRDEAGIHSVAIDPRDPERLVVAISCAGSVETRDGGASWTYRNEGVRKITDPGGDADFGHDVHFLARCGADPDVLWQSNHVGVFRSTDNGVSWTDLTRQPLVYFGFPVAAHPIRPQTAWLVPMESDMRRTSVGGALRVMRTDDGGANWIEQTEGLPQENAWDFPFRHALDVAEDGDRLAFGTTSGNLYLSDDGGGHWRALAHNLPPIYSVRFA